MCGVESVLGDAEVGIAVSLGAALPWLWVHLTDSAAADTAATFLEVKQGKALLLFKTRWWVIVLVGVAKLT